MTLTRLPSDLSIAPYRKMTQVFNNDVKLLMTFNTPDTPHKGILLKQETGTKIQNICRRDTGVVYDHYYTL